MHAENIGPARPRRNIWRILGWGGAGALILTPLVAMQFTTEVNWDETDFIVAAIIFGILGGLIEFAVRLSSNWSFRFGSMFAVLAGFMVIWSNLAVGMIGNEDNPTNLWFGLVLLIAIVGSIASRFRRRILPQAMFVAGIVQISIGVFAGILGSDARGGRFTIVLSVAWLISSLLFWLQIEALGRNHKPMKKGRHPFGYRPFETLKARRAYSASSKTSTGPLS